MHRYTLAILAWIVPLTLWATPNNNDNHFGFLGASLDNDNFKYLQDVGAGWMRPHPGPAVWEMIQSKDGGDYDWDFMDDVVKKANNYDINLLITIWPFAAWDQVRKADPTACEVADTDEFLPNKEAEEKGRTEYIPAYRCNPYDWAEYQRWVQALVERYDGDGRKDMPNLTIPVTHWEVMNESDLPGSETLDFYKEGSDEYYTLLRRTAKAIRQADDDAEIVIAGAAGANLNQAGEFMDFYYNLLTEHPQAKKYFTIGNVHHISVANETDFNVGVYQTMLDEFNINKPIWVTEAGAEGSPATEQKQYLRSATQAAIEAGAERIFYISYAFGDNYSSASQKRAKKVYRKLIKQWD
ncbi:MAG: hypothetical protein HYV33_05105 [Candidatus Kerfeldbacteria bacterium]|nr:hypothetical protein [Candidatus Kerfeldbacteria bacterium]